MALQELPHPLAQLASLVRIGMRLELKRMRTWIFVAVLLCLVWQLYWGGMGFGGMRASGVKLGTNSDYAIAAVLGAFSFMLMHFTATLCGDGVAEDERLGVSPLLGAAPLSPGVYLLGRFLGSWLSLLAIYAVFVAALFAGQFLPPDADKLTLAPRLGPYLRFGLWFVLVPTFFVGSLSFALGTLLHSMKPVYGAVTALLVIWYLVLTILGDRNARELAYLDPSGMTWLAERVAKSRGNAWLNENPVRVDLGFVLNRAVLTLFGLACLFAAVRRYRPEHKSADAPSGPRAAWPGRTWAWLRGTQRQVQDRYAVWSSPRALERAACAPAGAKRSWSQLWNSLRIELLLLGRERGLWVMVPMILLLCGVSLEAFAGPFRTPIYPVSSEYAAQMVPPLLIMLAGMLVFYTGEVFHRDDHAGVRPIVYGSPVPSAVLLAAKWAAMLLVALAIWVMTVGIAMVAQWIRWKRIDGRTYFEPWPYLEVGSRVVLPGIAILVTGALALNVLLRQRYVAYFASLVLGAGYVWLLVKGKRSLLANPLLFGHWSYSDLTRLAPYAERLRLHHLYWGSILVLLMALACLGLARSESPSTSGRLARAWRRAASQPLACACALLGMAGAIAAGLRIEQRGTLLGTRAEREASALAFEDRYAPLLHDPRLAPERVVLEIALEPDRRWLSVRGELLLTNPYSSPIATAYFSAAESLAIERFELEGAAAPHLRDGVLCIQPLNRPVAAGERRSLRFAWSGEVAPGFPESGGSQGTLLYPGTVFLSSYEPYLIPGMGLPLESFLLDRERRARHGRGEFLPLRALPAGSDVGGLFGWDLPFDLEVRIRAPGELEVLCSGDLVEVTEVDSTRIWIYRSRAPLRAFAVQAYGFASESYGTDSVHFHPTHRFNLDTVRLALEDGRREFGRSFGPYPHGLLRIAEFPRTASFAQSFPALMPFAESIGFLTHHAADPRKIDATYFVTAHEVAHQWWGYILHPGRAPGGQVLCESLAEYSASVLIEQRFGEDALLAFLEDEEDVYLRRRDPDHEKPLADLQLDAAEVWYQKGALVFHMLEEQLGRTAVLAALRAFTDRWRAPQARPLAHATLPDLWSEVKAQAIAQPAAARDLDAFWQTWFAQVLVPDAAFAAEPIVRRDADTCSVDVELTNLGPGRVRVPVEAFPEPWQAAERLKRHAGAPPPLHKSQPVWVWIEQGATARATLTCDFDPRWVVIDRRLACLDFDRTNNARKLSVSGAPSGAAPAPLAR
jgi:ABC-type transport system involved in multi-copper enzyme maturation permease subunit